ncbi:hypothetical protein EVAR_18277_1 [Eumeta japonica]|uniref:Uncharacterized protein n=1 Tax=Eumeta variegata TaxID=151549 RepID=A0A4C1UKG3_EUMVA|nr:hypothetical protein EVAR_18277_1 [Eumeta japonica]
MHFSHNWFSGSDDRALRVPMKSDRLKCVKIEFKGVGYEHTGEANKNNHQDCHSQKNILAWTYFKKRLAPLVLDSAATKRNADTLITARRTRLDKIWDTKKEL